MLFRFLSGIPHGAYFGTALLFGAKLAPEGRSTLYMSRVFAGLTVATIVGVPMATLLAQHFSWRWSLLLVSLLALLTCVLLWRVLPSLDTDSQGLRNDLAVLKNPLIWPIVGIAVIGFGGVFCLYTYLADTMLDVTQVPAFNISIAMIIFGIGSTVGNWLFGQVRDRVVARRHRYCVDLLSGAGADICASSQQFMVPIRCGISARCQPWFNHGDPGHANAGGEGRACGYRCFTSMCL
ncbi:MAG: MFS transporter [Shewanella fodinae]|nr:MFS transporter [Shewanella fodinae]